MKKSTLGRDLIIGLVFLGSLVVFGVVSIKVARLDILGQKRDIEVPFKEVNGIRVGDTVRYHGIQVGIVSEVKQWFENPDYNALLRISIDKTIELPRDSKFLVRSASTLGGKLIDIIPGQSAEKVQISEGAFSGNAEMDLFDNIGKLATEIREGNGLLHQVIRNESAGEDFTVFMSDLRQVVHSINEGKGILGALIKRQDLREKAEKLIADVGDTFESLKESQGTINLLLHDLDTRKKFKTVVDNLADFTTAIKEGRGTLSKLIYGTELHDALMATINDLKGTMKSVNEGEGTVGQLIKNREIYDKINRILDNVADAVEDFREQAPISTFANAVLVPF